MSKQPAADDEPGGLNVEVELSAEHEWQRLQLQAAGFTEFAAFRLSLSGADWHQAVRMLRDGAPQDLILDILL